MWTKNKNMLIGESLRGLLFLQYNFRVIFCKDFHTFLDSSVELLKIKSTVRYKWAHKKEDDSRDGSWVYTMCILYKNFSLFIIFVFLYERTGLILLNKILTLYPLFFWLISGKCPLLLWWVYSSPSQCVALFRLFKVNLNYYVKIFWTMYDASPFPVPILFIIDETHCVDASL